MREAINAALKDAMRSGDKIRTGTLRLINAAIKDRDIEARGNGKPPLGEEEILQLLQKMIKQRQESAKIYADNGREELAATENAEIAVVQDFLPRQMDDAEVAAAVDGVIADTGAEGLRDMGRVMAALKERYVGKMDFGRANGVVKARLSK